MERQQEEEAVAEEPIRIDPNNPDLLSVPYRGGAPGEKITLGFRETKENVAHAIHTVSTVVYDGYILAVVWFIMACTAGILLVISNAPPIAAFEFVLALFYIVVIPPVFYKRHLLMVLFWMQLASMLFELLLWGFWFVNYSGRHSGVMFWMITILMLGRVVTVPILLIACVSITGAILIHNAEYHKINQIVYNQPRPTGTKIE
jgi:hypothetical protein